ncbi:MAG TPA: type II secretion system protein [Coleofasciculaceae cyanobacterium]|jgi:prepilin-type N-terminal cleavage/methylation domain-containing protein
MVQVPSKGFSLAEILMVVAIMGLLAAFTVPRMIQPSANNGGFNAKANDAAVMIMSAYQALKANGGLSTSTTQGNLTQYMNFVKYDTSGTTIDLYQTGTTATCSAGNPCMVLHNGARLLSWTASFTGSTTNNAIWFLLDPDGKVTDGTTNGPGKGIELVLYYDGRIKTTGTAQANTVNSLGTWNPVPAADPPWFSWQ